MKVKDIIVEASKKWDPAEVAGLIRRDCGPFLAMIQNQVKDYTLYRGLEANLPFLRKQAVPVNRSPRDTSDRVHKFADEWFLEQFGVRYRSNATFATHDLDAASQYGRIYQLFPIGDFQFCWSPEVADMTYDLFGDDAGIRSDEGMKAYVDNLLVGAEYSDQYLTDAIASGHEVMIHCKSFYMLASFDRSHANYGLDDAVLNILQNGQAVNPTTPTAPAQKDVLKKKISYGPFHTVGDLLNQYNYSMKTYKKLVAEKPNDAYTAVMKASIDNIKKILNKHLTVKL